MALPLYLAMTAWEIANKPLPQRPAYMACHFAPYGAGLSNLPEALPEGSLLILNDRTPVWEHDPKLVASQLAETVERLKCSAVLLDFQRQKEPKTIEIAKAVTDTLPCPAAVSEYYAQDLRCPVFLSPPKPNKPLKQHLSPWADREIWLEATLETCRFTVCRDRCTAVDIPFVLPEEPFHRDTKLHCSYHIDVADEHAVFTISRTPEDLAQLLALAEALGITRAVGLYQQLGSFTQ